MNTNTRGEGRIYSVEAMEILNPTVNMGPSGYQGQPSDPLPDSVVRRLREMAESVKPENANREGEDTLGSPLRARQPNAQAVNFDRPPDVRPGAGVNAPETIAAFSDIVKVAGGSGALRIGKLRKRKTLGEFWRNAAVSRVRVAGDVNTAAHELAHALDQAIFGAGNNWDSKTGLSDGEQADLGRLGRDLYGDKIPYGGYKKEGFAEFMRLYLTDPAQALAKAPRFRAWWESRILDNNPALASVNIAETVPGMGHLLTEVPRNMVPQLGPSIADQIKAIDAKLNEVGASLKIEAEDTDMADVDEVSEQALTFFTQAVIPKNGEYGYIPEKCAGMRSRRGFTRRWLSWIRRRFRSACSGRR